MTDREKNYEGIAYNLGYKLGLVGFPFDMTFAEVDIVCSFKDAYVLGFHDGKLKRRRYANV